MPSIDHVAIIGGGFSGSLLAINLLRHDGPKATLIERRPVQVGRGVAYGSARHEHVLNVRAANMSAFPDQPDHFVRWLEATGRDEVGFVRRNTYGAYLTDMLAQALTLNPGRLTVVKDEAVGIDTSEAQPRVRLATGAPVKAGAIVLAPGNLPPHHLPQFASVSAERSIYRADPWAADIAEGLAPTDTVLLMGTGLTAVDVALSLDSVGFSGKVIALSRRGLMPHSHVADGKAPESIDRPAAGGSHLIAHVRRRALDAGWRAAIDELRPHTQDMWRSATPVEQRRFLRHLRPFWDTHRHRLAPVVAERIRHMQHKGRLTFTAGKVESAELTEHGAVVAWRPRGQSESRRLEVARIINCTGPQGDIGVSQEPLLKTLYVQGVIRPDPLRLGIDVDTLHRVLDTDGRANDHLLAVGPMTRGAFWEIVAVPDLRVQSWNLARRLSAAHWVSGEGL
jgi:uncharacterized NAD(P)/FAD-binding protein YdhS